MVKLNLEFLLSQLANFSFLMLMVLGGSNFAFFLLSIVLQKEGVEGKIASRLSEIGEQSWDGVFVFLFYGAMMVFGLQGLSLYYLYERRFYTECVFFGECHYSVLGVLASPSLFSIIIFFILSYFFLKLFAVRPNPTTHKNPTETGE